MIIHATGGAFLYRHCSCVVVEALLLHMSEWGTLTKISKAAEAGILVYLRYEPVLKIDPYQRNSAFEINAK
jgi:hypothetical protein